MRAIISTLCIFFRLGWTATGATKEFGFTAGTVSFDESARVKSLIVPTIPNPILLYSISSLSINTHFSFYSKPHYSPLSPSTSNLSLQVRINQTNRYRITLGYAVLEQMPNIQVFLIHLKQLNVTQKYVSSKNFTKSNHLHVTSNLVGFSSSKIARSIYWYCAMFEAQHQFWTQSWMESEDFIMLQIILVVDFYVSEQMICGGSYIYTNSEANNSVAPYQLRIDPQLKYLLGINQLFLSSFNFQFNTSEMVVYINSTGTYGFSVVVINTTCQVIGAEKKDRRRQGNSSEKVYVALFVFFFIASFLVAVGLLVYGCKDRCRRQSRERVEAEVVEEMDVDVNRRIQGNHSEPDL